MPVPGAGKERRKREEDEDEVRPATSAARCNISLWSTAWRAASGRPAPRSARKSTRAYPRLAARRRSDRVSGSLQEDEDEGRCVCFKADGTRCTRSVFDFDLGACKLHVHHVQMHMQIQSLTSCSFVKSPLLREDCDDASLDKTTLASRAGTATPRECPSQNLHPTRRIV